MHIVIGHTEKIGNETATCIYCGKDRGAAIKCLNSPDSDIVRTELFSYMEPTQRKFHEAVAKKKAAKKKVK